MKLRSIHFIVGVLILGSGEVESVVSMSAFPWVLSCWESDESSNEKYITCAVSINFVGQIKIFSFNFFKCA